MTRAYLNARKMADPVVANAWALEILTDWERLQITTALGVKFAMKGRVVLRRPWWLPAPLYRSLLRSIIVERVVTERHRR